MEQQKQIEILQNLSLNKELLSYSEIYKIEDVNESCFIVYLFCSSFTTSHHIFIIADNKSHLKAADFHIQKHLSLQKGLKSLSFYLCLQGNEHKIILSEDKNQKQYSILYPFNFQDIRTDLKKAPLKKFPQEKLKMTYILMIIIIVAYGLDFLSLQFDFLKPWFTYIGISLRQYINHDFYNMGMALISHHGLTHLGFNLLSLIYIGRLLERHFSSFKFLILVIMSGLCGALGSIAFIPQESVSVGASGFIMGLIGSLLSVTFMDKSKWPLFYQDQYLKLRSSLLILLALNLLIPFFIKNIDSAAHICGFAGGVLLTFLFGLKKQYKIKVFLWITFFVFILFLEHRIDQKIDTLHEFENIQRELISSLNTKEYMMKRNILEISKLNKGIKFEFIDANGVNYPIKPKIAAKDPLLERLNIQLTRRLQQALNQKNTEEALANWKSEYDEIELEILVKYKLIKANEPRDTK